MHRKIMDSNKHKSKNGYAEGKIGNILGIQDKNGNWLRVGDKVCYDGIDGRILYNGYDYYVMYSYSMWYGDNEFDHHCYGKCAPLPLDNGARMELELLVSYDV